MTGKAAISLATGLEDPEKVTVGPAGSDPATPPNLVAVAAAEQGRPMPSPGEQFAMALSNQDGDALCAALAGTIDFQALTPRRHWQASTGRQAAEEIILGQWFGPQTQILELCSVVTGQVADTAHVAYRMRVRRDGGDYLVEQQAYYRTDGARITWMRVLCSGYLPAGSERAAARG